MKRAILAALFAVSSPVFAQGWYAGAGIGSNSHEAVWQAMQDFTETETVNCSAAGLANCSGTASADTDSIGLGLFAGYRFNNNVAIEAAYTDLGEYDGSGLTSGNWTPDGVNFYTASYNITETGKASALSVSAVGFLPVTADKNGSLIGKLGLARWKADVSGSTKFCDGAGTCYIGSGSDSESDTSPMFGFGYEHRFNNVGVRGTYEIIKKVGIDPYYDDVTRLSLNVLGYF